VSFLRRYIVSTDHKVIAKQFLWAGLLFLAIGGLLAMVMRWQWSNPGQPVPLVGDLLLGDSGGALTPSSYTALFTNHGLIMIFFAITPILIGCFGNFVIPLAIGARDMAFPILNMLSFWIFAASQVFALAALVAPSGAPSAGWTMYPPLSTGHTNPGAGQTLMVVALLLTGVASLMGAVNYVTTVVTCRAPGMKWVRLPLTVWGLWVTAILNMLFVPVLAVATILMVLDRVAGTQFFAAATGDPLLYQHLFWIFGHPEVYILILPVWGIVGDLVAFFARKPAFWYRGTVGAMIAVAVMSGLVYGHHMYQAGIGPLLGASFEALTLAISIPAVVLYVNWMCTVWRGAIRRTVPMMFALGMMFVFGIGGLTGLYLGAITTDMVLHDTMWVVGHFHLIMAAATFLGSFAGIYFWFPKMFGRLMNPLLGHIHMAGSVVFLVLTFGGQLLAGYAGQHRRLFDPFQFEFIDHLRGLNAYTTYFAFALGLVQLVFVYNFIHSMIRGKKADDNPWQVGTLEWTVSSPPPHDNFAELPTVYRGPHELSVPRFTAALDRDWIAQSEAEPNDGEDSDG
jgi:cytochrome c oxidase subunit 1